MVDLRRGMVIVEAEEIDESSSPAISLERYFANVLGIIIEWTTYQRFDFPAAEIINAATTVMKTPLNQSSS